jgi:hypothetical protein
VGARDLPSVRDGRHYPGLLGGRRGGFATGAVTGANLLEVLGFGTVLAEHTHHRVNHPARVGVPGVECRVEFGGLLAQLDFELFLLGVELADVLRRRPVAWSRRNLLPPTPPCSRRPACTQSRPE